MTKATKKKVSIYVDEGKWFRVRMEALILKVSAGDYLMSLVDSGKIDEVLMGRDSGKSTAPEVEHLIEATKEPVDKPAKKVSKASSGETLSVAEKKAVVEGLRSNPVFNAIPKKKGE